MERPGIQNRCGFAACTPAVAERYRMVPGTGLGLGRLAGNRLVEAELAGDLAAGNPVVAAVGPVGVDHPVVGSPGPGRHADGPPQPCAGHPPPSCEPSTPCESP